MSEKPRKGRDELGAEIDSARLSSQLDLLNKMVHACSRQHVDWMRVWECDLRIAQSIQIDGISSEIVVTMHLQPDGLHFKYVLHSTSPNAKRITRTLEMAIGSGGEVYYGEYRRIDHSSFPPPPIKEDATWTLNTPHRPVKRDDNGPTSVRKPVPGSGSATVLWGWNTEYSNNLRHRLRVDNDTLAVTPEVRKDINLIQSLLTLTGKLNPVEATLIQEEPIEGLDPTTWYTYEIRGKSLGLGLSPYDDETGWEDDSDQDDPGE